MSIVNYVSNKLPNEGDVVYCDNGKYSSDRAIYENGQFIGGGDFPVRPYPMSCVSKWFNLDEYDACKGGGSYGVSFKDAEAMTLNNYTPKQHAKVEVKVPPYSLQVRLSGGRVVTVKVGDK